MQHFNPYLPFLLKRLSILVLALCCYQVNAQVFPMDTIMRNGERPNRINMVYMADGYLAGQVATFVTNATTINTALFSQAPFSTYKNFFNSYAIKSPSAETGAKHPGTAGDENTSGSQPVLNPNNYYQSTFDYFSIHRLLVPQNNAGVYSALSSNLPDYDQAFVVVNSSYYGGSGGAIATASIDPSSAEVAIHELGHSFAGLADEYWAGAFYAAEKPNMTQNNNPATVKWKNWYGTNNIGIFPHGSSGLEATWYKPHQLCKMQYLGYPFCSVCNERIVDRIHELVKMADNIVPATNSFTLSNTDPVNFSVTTVKTIPSTVQVKWYLNGSSTAFATNQDAVSVPFVNLNYGNNTVVAQVIDNNDLSKSYLPAAGYINTITWTVNKPATLPLRLLKFAGNVVEKSGVLLWEVDDTKDLESFTIEKSKDGNNFTTFSNVKGDAYNKKYTFTDPNLLFPFSFYRLRINQKDGAGFYSSVLRLQNSFDKLNYKVYQDAALHKYHLSVGLQDKQDISITIADAAGRIVYRKAFGKPGLQLEYDFNLQGKPAGIYFMNIMIGNNLQTVQLLAN